MENNILKENVRKRVKEEIAISKFNKENITIKSKKIKLVSKKNIAIASVCIILTSSVALACKTIIRYNPFNGKPIILADKEVPEEINVVIPNNYTDKKIESEIKKFEELKEKFESIMCKYHGKEKIEQILASYENEKLLYCVIEIFDTMNPTDDEKQVLKEFSQMLVDSKQINGNKFDDELKKRINNL